MFAKWLAQQGKGAAAPKPDPVAVKIEVALADYVDDRSFRLGNYGYTVRRGEGQGIDRIRGDEERKTESVRRVRLVTQELKTRVALCLPKWGEFIRAIRTRKKTET